MDERTNYFTEIVSKRYNEYEAQKAFAALNYIEQLLVLISTITKCVWIYALLH